MNIASLIPRPEAKLPFRLAHLKFAPTRSGCYVLSTFDGFVLYLGLAIDLRRRLEDHLGSPDKTRLVKGGRAVWFHWLQTSDVNKVERTWMNIHIQHEGRLPELNAIYSPTAT